MHIKIYELAVTRWLRECFGKAIMSDKVERNFRFFEEAAELVQALGMTKEECYQLVDYVYNRPVGDPFQEVGGVGVTLAALCQANKIDMQTAMTEELFRITQPAIMEKIRIKQQNKPNRGPCAS